MNLAEIKRLEGNRFALSGDVGFATVSRLLAVGMDLFQGCKSLEIDLSGTTACDSAAVALLVEWAGYAERKSIEIAYHNVPEHVLKIASISEIDTMLPVAGNN
ncbi:MAG: STAS domain-containing protein [Gammaproteobacteria bacterium]|nr:STAS domain-containing protein [Gammaproteobacteria bacterium]